MQTSHETCPLYGLCVCVYICVCLLCACVLYIISAMERENVQSDAFLYVCHTHASIASHRTHTHTHTHISCTAAPAPAPPLACSLLSGQCFVLFFFFGDFSLDLAKSTRRMRMRMWQVVTSWQHVAMSAILLALYCRHFGAYRERERGRFKCKSAA